MDFILEAGSCKMKREFEELEKQLLELLKRGEFDVYCEKVSDERHRCEKYECEPEDFCKVLGNYYDLLDEAYEVCRRFAEKMGLKIKEETCDSDSQVLSSSSGSVRTGSEYCIAITVDEKNDKMYHVHVVTRETFIGGKRSLKVEGIRIVEEPILRGIAREWADNILWHFIRSEWRRQILDIIYRLNEDGSDENILRIAEFLQGNLQINEYRHAYNILLRVLESHKPYLVDKILRKEVRRILLK